MSHPRTPNSAGEYTEPDGRIRISRERYERLVAATQPATMARAYAKATLDCEFVTPGPRVSLSQEALDALEWLIVDAAREGLGIASANSPALAAREHLASRLELTING